MSEKKVGKDLQLGRRRRPTNRHQRNFNGHHSRFSTAKLAAALQGDNQRRQQLSLDRVEAGRNEQKKFPYMCMQTEVCRSNRQLSH